MKIPHPATLFLLFLPFTGLFSCKERGGETAPDEMSVYDSGGKRLNSLELEGTASETTITLYSSGPWTAGIKSGDGWLSIAPSSGGKGTTRLALSAKANSQASKRTGSIVFSCGNVGRILLQVNQAASNGGGGQTGDNTFDGKTKVVAHRGYYKSRGDSENSLSALKAAQELGIFGSEFDVWITTDGVVVVNHNASYPTDPKGQRIDTHTYDDIKDVTLSNGEKIPTLGQFLDQGLEHPEMKLVLEIKTQGTRAKNDRIVDACVKAVKEKNMLNQIIWIAFDYENCLRVHNALPEAIVQYLNGDKTPAELKRDGIIGLDYSNAVMSRNMNWIDQAHSLGMLVNVWTIDNPSDMIRYIRNKVDFITTNYPEICKRYTGQYSQQSP